ncbi:MAG: AAA family ATPase [Candidatus Pacebacteria bacterium]|nr:AAA family ATPase [Candidatus Paceibacterota bacterium]
MTQEQAFKIMKTGINIYLTGSAGSGKTYLLNKYIKYLNDHNIPVAVTASTGIAATHMNGMTIHGWSGIGIRSKLDEKDLEQIEEKKYLWKRYEKARVLIIDEVSMLHGHQLEMVERICRRFKRNDKPFGGLQVILSGDFFQLPPVQKTNSEEQRGNDMIYSSKVWATLNPAVCYLTEQHRQEDEILTRILNTIRDNNLEEEHFKYLESRIDASLKNNTKATKLYTHNINVDNENYTELDKIDSLEKRYQMTSSGSDILVEILKKSCLAHEELRLKIGAEVMCIKNNLEAGYVNGTRGQVIGFDEYSNYPIIKLSNDRNITISPVLWAIEEDNKIKASITQIPLRLAWAITIHKSQGMSLDNAEIDLSRTFSYGMGYVALSRVRTLSGIRLVGFKRESLIVNPEVLSFDQELKNESFQNELLFKKLKRRDYDKLEKDFILKMGGTIEIATKNNKEDRKINNSKIPTILITKELLKDKKSIAQIAKHRKLKEGTIISHIEQIILEDKKIYLSHIRPKDDKIKLISKINKKLKGDEVGKLTPIKKLLEKDGHRLSFEEIRLAKIFI